MQKEGLTAQTSSKVFRPSAVCSFQTAFKCIRRERSQKHIARKEIATLSFSEVLVSDDEFVIVVLLVFSLDLVYSSSSSKDLLQDYFSLASLC